MTRWATAVVPLPGRVPEGGSTKDALALGRRRVADPAPPLMPATLAGVFDYLNCDDVSCHGFILMEGPVFVQFPSSFELPIDTIFHNWYITSVRLIKQNNGGHHHAVSPLYDRLRAGRHSGTKVGSTDMTEQQAWEIYRKLVRQREKPTPAVNPQWLVPRPGRSIHDTKH